LGIGTGHRLPAAPHGDIGEGARRGRCGRFVVLLSRRHHRGTSLWCDGGEPWATIDPAGPLTASGTPTLCFYIGHMRAASSLAAPQIASLASGQVCKAPTPSLSHVARLDLLGWNRKEPAKPSPCANVIILLQATPDGSCWSSRAGRPSMALISIVISSPQGQAWHSQTQSILNTPGHDRPTTSR
jgi:hypothetical protein